MDKPPENQINVDPQATRPSFGVAILKAESTKEGFLIAELIFHSRSTAAAPCRGWRPTPSAATTLDSYTAFNAANPHATGAVSVRTYRSIASDVSRKASTVGDHGKVGYVRRKHSLPYYTNFTPSADYAAAHQVGTIMHINNAIARGTGTAEVKITLPATTTFTINAPKGADVALYNQLKNYNTVRINWNSTEAQSDGTVDYIFNVAKSNSMSYRVSMEGKRTQVGFFSNAFGPTVELADRIVVDFGSGSPTEQGSSGTYNGESSLLLNLNERNKLNLTVGESYKLRGYRAAWQLVNDVSANIMIEPDFHYTVLSGAHGGDSG